MTSGSVLILGATGIIGRELAGLAIGSGYSVIGVSRRKPAVVQRGVQYLAVDVDDRPRMHTALGGEAFDAVIDLVSFTADSLEGRIRSLAGQCEQYVFVSSATVYRSARRFASIKEDSERVSEGWLYPLRKMECEDRLRRVCHELDLRYTIVRPYITYSDQRLPFGPWEAEDVLTRLRECRPIVLGDEICESKTSVTDSRDVARAIIGLVGNVRALDDDFIVASPETHTWGELLSMVGGLLGVEPWIVPASVDVITAHFPRLSGKVEDRCLSRSFDATKLLSACPGFSFRYSARDGFSLALTERQALGSRYPGFRSVGEMDRLVEACSPVGSCVSRERRSFVSDLRRTRMVNYLKYQVGYRSWLGRLVDGLRRVGSLLWGGLRPGVSNYE